VCEDVGWIHLTHDRVHYRREYAIKIWIISVKKVKLSLCLTN
jgi:hypothetical protein